MNVENILLVNIRNDFALQRCTQKKSIEAATRRDNTQRWFNCMRGAYSVCLNELELPIL